MDDRRKNVPFDPFYFEKLKKDNRKQSIADTFKTIHQKNHWSGSESVSGEGSGREQTRVLSTALPRLLTKLQIDVLLDLPCGDSGWMRHLELPVIRYIGADIVEELISENQTKYRDHQRQFLTLDMTSDPLPDADLLLCRDCLVHLSFEDIFSALENIRRSRITYILTSTFTGCKKNEDIQTGDWRLLNLEKPPFSFPPPLYLINEKCSEGDGRFIDKSLGLWLVKDL